MNTNRRSPQSATDPAPIRLSNSGWREVQSTPFLGPTTRFLGPPTRCLSRKTPFVSQPTPFLGQPTSFLGQPTPCLVATTALPAQNADSRPAKGLSGRGERFSEPENPLADRRHPFSDCEDPSAGPERRFCLRRALFSARKPLVAARQPLVASSSTNGAPVRPQRRTTSGFCGPHFASRLLHEGVVP